MLTCVFTQMVSYEGKLEIYLKELTELTVRVAILQSSADNYIKLDFELLRIELREFDALVSQLRDSLNSSSPLFDSLYTEVRKSHLNLWGESGVGPENHPGLFS